MTTRIVPAIAAIQATTDLAPRASEGAHLLPPVVWLVGKVQSGKTSIIRAITDSTDAEIGVGFKACTATTNVFDFPGEAPVLRFLDTRGLGESGYDPSEDLKFAEQKANLVIATMRAMDAAQHKVVDVLTAIRTRHPSMPIVVAQTCLHEGYPSAGAHLVPYPFSTDDQSVTDPRVAPELVRCLNHQRGLLAKLPGAASILFVPIDFTTASDGLVPIDYGIEALIDSLIRIAPTAVQASLLAMPVSAKDSRARNVEPIILGHAMAAAGSDLVPIAGGLAASAVQARLLQRVGQMYGVEWNRRSLAELAAALGSGVVVRALAGIGARQLAKLIPVYGQTVATASAAVMSFALTYAIGKAAVYFLTQRQRGLDTQGTADAYQSALRYAFQLAKERKLDAKHSPSDK